MKSTRRHELQTNELADAIGHVVSFVRPHLQIIALAGAVVVLVLLAVIILPAIRGSTADLAAATFAAAQNTGDAPAVRQFLDDYPDSAQAPVARLLLADRLLSNVVTAGAKPDGDPLAEASQLYTQVAASSESLAPLARVGLALVTIQRGDLEKGREALQEVVSKWPQSIGAEKARAHIEALAGYEPIVFSDEPLEEPKPPEAEEPTKAEPKEGDAKPPDAQPADAQPVPDAKPVPPPAGTEEKKESKPVG